MSSAKREVKSSFKMNAPTILADGCRFGGHIETSGTVGIFGAMEGTIKCNSLETFRDSKVCATVEAVNVTVAGFFEGVHAEAVHEEAVDDDEGDEEPE